MWHEGAMKKSVFSVGVAVWVATGVLSSVATAQASDDAAAVACARALESFVGRSVLTRDPRSGLELVGFSGVTSLVRDSGEVPASLLMKTPDERYYYLESSMFGVSGAELLRCSPKTGQVGTVTAARSVGCSELPAREKLRATYLNCE